MIEVCRQHQYSTMNDIKNGMGIRKIWNEKASPQLAIADGGNVNVMSFAMLA